MAGHIQVDSEEHTPMAMRMATGRCGDVGADWAECADTVKLVLATRARRYDGILAPTGDRATA